MNAISQSIWFLLSHSIVTLISVLVLTVVFVFLQIALSISKAEASMAFQAAMMTNLTLATFMGVYLGGALLKLKQNYLWTINQKYRSAIMTAYLGIIGVFCLIQTPFLFLNLDRTALVLLVPYCVAIYSSHMVLGKNVVQKIAIPVIPYLIVQLHRIGYSDSQIVMAIVASTAVLLYVMVHNRLYPDGLSRKRVNQASASGMAATTGALAPSLILSFNQFIGVLVASWVTNSKGSVAWAVLMPHTKLAMSSLMYVLMIFSFVLLTADQDKQLLEAFTILFLSTLVISLVMESRFLIRQTRYFAHLFAGPKHRHLKSKILFSIDKSFLTNAFIFVSGVLIAANIFSMTVNTPYLLWSATAVILIGFALYPALLCLNWVHLSFSQVMSVGIYAALVFFTNLYIKTHPDEAFFSTYPMLFLLACLLVRSATQLLFWQRPIEKLFKNK